MNKRLILMMLALALLYSSCQERDKVIKHPLLVKYLSGTTNELFSLIRRNRHTIIVKEGINGRMEELLSYDALAEVVRCPNLVRILREGRVAITNELIASDIANVLWIVMHGELSTSYLVDSAVRQGSVWCVQYRYYESPPDNCCRWPSGYIVYLYVDDDNIIENIEHTALPPL